MRYLIAILATLAGLVLGVLAFSYTGLYNVAASEGHAGFTDWYLDTLSDRSIEARASSIARPTTLVDSAYVARGAVAFSQMCQTCHGAP